MIKTVTTVTCDDCNVVSPEFNRTSGTNTRRALEADGWTCVNDKVDRCPACTVKRMENPAARKTYERHREMKGSAQ